MPHKLDYFQKKTAFIIGGSSGIGLATAKLLASRGSRCIIFGRDPKKLAQAREEIGRHGPQADAYTLDATDDAAVRSVMGRAVADRGTPHILINSAGTALAERFDKTGPEAFDRVMKTNLYGVRNVVAALLPHMKGRGGRIVNVGSAAGLFGTYGYTAYGTSKWALRGFSECLRLELKPEGTGVILVCPPEVDTPLLREEAESSPPETKAMKALAGFLQPDYVAALILRAVERNQFLVIPGFKARFLYQVQRFSPGRISRLISDAAVSKAADNKSP